MEEVSSVKKLGKYLPVIQEYLKKHYPELGIKKVAEEMEKAFGRPFSKTFVRGLVERMGLFRDPKALARQRSASNSRKGTSVCEPYRNFLEENLGKVQIKILAERLGISKNALRKWAVANNLPTAVFKNYSGKERGSSVGKEEADFVYERGVRLRKDHLRLLDKYLRQQYAEAGGTGIHRRLLEEHGIWIERERITRRASDLGLMVADRGAILAEAAERARLEREEVERMRKKRARERAADRARKGKKSTRKAVPRPGKKKAGRKQEAGLGGLRWVKKASLPPVYEKDECAWLALCADRGANHNTDQYRER